LFFVLIEINSGLNIKGTAPQLVKHIAYIFLALFLFLFSIDLLTSGLSASGRNLAQSILDITTNPFVSLFIGLLVTAIIQSSSTTTSMIVAMVASGSLDMQRAIPIVLGANIGTTLTSTLVSLSFITKKQEFMKAFSSATVHDIFNILTTLILFPLQYKYDFLGKMATRITNLFPIREVVQGGTLHSMAQTKSMVITDFLVDWIDHPWIIIIGAVLLLIYSIKLLTNLIYNNFFVPVRDRLDSLVFNKPLKSFGWGLFLTASWQSSSIATSIIVPLVATSKVTVKQAYPFIVGANIGTTITALLAAIFNAPAALSIAIVHLLFNVIGGMIFLLVPGLKRIPITLSEILGKGCYRRWYLSIVYIILTFFLLPFAFIYFTK